MVECLAQWQSEHFSCWAGRFQPCTLLGDGVALVVKPQKQNWIIKVFLAPPWSQFCTTCLEKTGFEWAERSHLHMTNLSILRKVSALAENICVLTVLLLVQAIVSKWKGQIKLREPLTDGSTVVESDYSCRWNISKIQGNKWCKWSIIDEPYYF